MKFFTAAVLSAAAVSAQPYFAVSNFAASCYRDTKQCSYSFGVILSHSQEKTPVQCSIVLPANENRKLPNVEGAQCQESSKTFNVVRSEKGLTLTVFQPVSPSTNVEGKHFIPNKQIVTSHMPDAVLQMYQGPTDFELN